MSMNKTCPISNFTSVDCSAGTRTFYYLKTRDLTSRFGCLCKLPHRNNLFRQRFEARIAAQRVEQRVNSDISYVRTGAILVTLFKPVECLLFVAQSNINKGKAVG